MHPISIGELLRTSVGTSLTADPERINDESYAALLRFGGYPDPFLRGETRFYNRWRRLRSELLFREDLRDLTRIQEAGHVEVLGDLLASHLLKAVHWWTDIGLGQYDLYYLRDKQKRDVDFLVVRDGNPWFLVEVKSIVPARTQLSQLV